MRGQGNSKLADTAEVYFAELGKVAGRNLSKKKKKKSKQSISHKCGKI